MPTIVIHLLYIALIAWVCVGLLACALATTEIYGGRGGWSPEDSKPANYLKLMLVIFFFWFPLGVSELIENLRSLRETDEEIKQALEKCCNGGCEDCES